MADTEKDTDTEIPGCGHRDPMSPHPCPYAQDIRGDDEKRCTCCPSCEHECARDI